MINIDSIKEKYPALYKFFKLNFDEHFSMTSGGYKIDYDFKEEIYKDLEKIMQEQEDSSFKIKKYELEKIPMLVASNKVFKDKCKELNEKTEKLSNQNQKDKKIMEELAKYINRCDHETIWCLKSKCDQKCYECILEDFSKKFE